ncbi:MAG: tubulin-like doman-containing protein, partial [Blastocatellia bacterium]
LFNERPGAVPPYVGLFYLDTVAPQREGDVSLLDEEYSRLVVRDVSEMLKNPDTQYIRDWFPSGPGMNVQTTVHGAAQIRPVGRLALHAQPDRLLKQLRKRLAALTDREQLREIANGETIDDQGSIEVYILASLCGGTGSSLIVDVAKLVAEELKDAPTVRVIGVLLLPGPFRDLPGTNLVTANAYAALKEIDYLASPRDPVEITFGPGRTVALDRSPFDFVYLVDSVGEQFDTTRDLSQLARQMAYLPYLMSAPSIGSRVREVLHNLIPQLEAKDRVHGKRATYASFGVATMEIPASSVAKARNEFERELVSILSADTEEVQGLGDLGIRSAIERRAVERFPETLEMLLLDFDFGRRSESIDELKETYAAAVELVEEYAKKVTEGRLSAMIESAENAIRSLLLDASTHPGRLPSAIRECSRVHEHLSNVRESLRAPNKAAENAEKERHRTWEICQKAFKSRRRRTREPAALDWKDTVNSLVLPSRLELAIRELIADAAGNLNDRILAARDSCIAAKKKLEETFRSLSGVEPRIEEPPSAFTRYCDAGLVRPHADAGKFLAGCADEQPWFGLSETGLLIAVRRFSELE